MINNNSMNKIFALSLLSLTCASTAHAGTPSGIVTASANAKFSSPGSVSLNINPVADLKAGKINASTKIASAVAKINPGAIISYRWTPGTGDISGNTVQNMITIKGATDPTNTLKLEIDPAVKMKVTDGGDGWIIPGKKLRNLPLLAKTSVSQDVNADSYVLSIDAAQWVN